MSDDSVFYDQLILDSIYPEPRTVFEANIPPLSAVKDDCLVVLDTNALLVPYCVKKEALEQIERVYSHLVERNRLLIPAQVAREFARNRPVKLTELHQKLHSKYDSVKKVESIKYPLLESMKEYKQILTIERKINDLVSEHHKALDKVLRDVREWYWNDPVSVLYSRLFSTNVFAEPTIDKNSLKNDLLWRREHKIPPGYKDQAKGDGGIGDLVIWHTILAIGKDRGSNLVLVTGEHKADWWHRSNNQGLYVRYELVNEYSRTSNGKAFHIVRLSQLLDMFDTDATVVKEVEKGEVQVAFQPPQSRKQLGQYSSRFRFMRDDEIPDQQLYSRSWVEVAVVRWLRDEHGMNIVDQHPDHFHDILCTDDTGRLTGVQIKCLRDSDSWPTILNRWVRSLLSGQAFPGQRSILVMVFQSKVQAQAAVEWIPTPHLPLHTKLVTGHIDRNGVFRSASSIDTIDRSN